MKRAFDIIVSLIVLIVLSPIILLTAMLIFLFSGKPIIFKQIRPGLNGKPFTIYKFRTMNNITGVHQENLDDEYRITRLGKILRRFSIDELPQFFNVLKGDLSIVGPRPLLMEYLELYSSSQFRRHEVKPGITGWAQINGRNLVSWEKRFEMDVWYVDHQSFCLDIKIIFRTFANVIKGIGISQRGHPTMTKFQGTKSD